MQNRIADIDKRQLKKAPTANDIAWSLRKREILAMNKVRFATTQTGYHNIKRKHLIGFDRLASRLPSRGIGAKQNEDDLINRVILQNTLQNELVTGNKRELRQESGIPRSFSSVNEADILEAKAEDQNDIRQPSSNTDYDEFEEIANSFPSVETYMKVFTESQREAYNMSPSVAARIETDPDNNVLVTRNGAYSVDPNALTLSDSTTKKSIQKKEYKKKKSIPMQFAVSKRGVTTSGVYNENTRKLRRTKEKANIQWDSKLAELELINEEKMLNKKESWEMNRTINEKESWEMKRTINEVGDDNNESDDELGMYYTGQNMRQFDKKLQRMRQVGKVFKV